MERTGSARAGSVLWLPLAVLLAGGSLLALGGCQSGTTAADDRAACERTVDHMVDLEIGPPPDDSARAAELDKHRAVLKRAVGKQLMAECMSGPAGIRDCELSAATRADLERCRH